MNTQEKMERLINEIPTTLQQCNVIGSSFIPREMTEDEISMFVMLTKMDNAKSEEVFELLVKKGGWQLEGIKKRFSAYNLSVDNKTMIMILTISNGVIGKCAKYVDDIVVRSAKLNINEISFDDFSKRIYPMGYPSF